MRSRGLWAETEEVMRPLIPQDEAERLIEFRLSAAIDAQPEERWDKIPAWRSASSTCRSPESPS